MPVTATRARAWAARIPSVAVLSALAIDVAGGRWGSYIGTPLSMLHLADLLWGVGALAAVVRYRRWALPRPAVVAAVVAAAYLLVRFVATLSETSPGTSSGTDAFLLVRDLTPFAYLALVPLAALALVDVGPRALLWLLRICPLVMAAGFALFTLGVGFSDVGRALGGPELAAIWFPGRPVIIGVVMAVGVVAWGRFPAVPDVRPGLRALFVPQRLVQVLLVLVGAFAASQSGQVAVVVAIGWAVLRERVAITGPRARVAGAVALAGLAAVSLLAAGSALVLARETTVAIKSADAPPGDTDAVEPVRTTYKLPDIPVGFETIAARLSTWASVLHAVGREASWPVGAGLGRADTLLGVCNVTPAEFAARPGSNKCDVDSGNTAAPLRDPHNWAMNLLLYHGLAGLVVFVAVLLAYWWRPPPDPVFSLTAGPSALYALAASFGVVFSSPFGLLPLATFAAFALSRRATARVGGTDNL